MKRIFIALKIECQPGILQLLSFLKTRLSKDKIKWVETENLHLTLKFIGETSDDKVQLISNAINEIKDFKDFEINFTTTGIFGSRYEPKVIWIGLSENESLINLVNHINTAIRALGYESDRQNFVPHLTLGRINYLNDKQYFQEIINQSRSFPISSQSINEYHLFESKLRQTGPEYTIIKTFYLSN